MRIARIAGGFTLVAGGLVMLVTPGPGWLTIAAGLALLASEFAWAHRLLDSLTHGAMKLSTRGRRALLVRDRLEMKAVERLMGDTHRTPLPVRGRAQRQGRRLAR